MGGASTTIATHTTRGIAPPVPWTSSPQSQEWVVIWLEQSDSAGAQTPKSRTRTPRSSCALRHQMISSITLWRSQRLPPDWRRHARHHQHQPRKNAKKFFLQLSIFKCLDSMRRTVRLWPTAPSISSWEHSFQSLPSWVSLAAAPMPTVADWREPARSCLTMSESVQGIATNDAGTELPITCCMAAEEAGLG